MANSGKKNVLIFVVVGIIVVAAVLYFGIIKDFISIPGISSPGATGLENEQVSPIDNIPEVPGEPSFNQDIPQVGAPAKNDALPGSPAAPQQSGPVSQTSLPKNAVNLVITAKGFNPSSFTAQSGKEVVLAITSGDTLTHVFMFDDSSLSGVALGVAPQETRSITFNAPTTKAGEYTFRCDVPGHKDRGEVGKMIVK